MEKEQRTRLQKATQDARRLLEEEFRSQLLQTYDIDAEKVRWAEEPGSHLLAEQRLIREKLIAWIEHKEAQINDRKEALLLALREMAFTALNRFVALKLMEARELVRPCVSGGLESAGFLEFTAVAQGLLANQESSYRLYLETIFEDVSRELRALFDPRDPASLLWPKRAALLELLDILNRPELGELWIEDETLGWVYQYFNGDAERKKMREESAAPRNSRELAVRNQFFTPRYVVEFLTDNTLGRIWYEMRKGDTGLKERCRYMVRRPNEIWLQPGEEPPAQPDTEEALSQEELLRQPAHIPHRQLKDPREIRMLDPACGSMHFGLYAFDLYLEIYKEAWEIAQGSDEHSKPEESFSPFVSYVAGFVGKSAFLREVPRLILQHNIHGIDIDPRATQIARLTLWLRAQRAWNEQQLQVADRPAITRSNVVCAEPMPGEKALLRDFIEQQFPADEQKALGFLLNKVFDRMALAGEAGSLLRIEEEIRGTLAEAKRLWKTGPQYEQPGFFGKDFASDKQINLSLGFSGVTNIQFWEQAEQRIYAALLAYSEYAEDAFGIRKGLFVEDIAQGFALIDICHKRYDAVLTNPPFGEHGRSSRQYLDSSYPLNCGNVLCSFILRMIELCESAGMSGTITDRTWLQKTTYESFREELITGASSLEILVDIGWGVLDGAQVATSMQIVSRQFRPSPHLFSLDIRQAEENNEDHDKPWYLIGARFRTTKLKAFDLFPDKALAHWCPDRLKRLFELGSSIDPHFGDSRRGISAGDTTLAFRLEWEVPLSEKGQRWAYVQNGGAYSPFYRDTYLVCSSEREFAALDPLPGSRLQNLQYMGMPGLTWSKRSDYLAPSILPSGHCFTDAGNGLFPRDMDVGWFLLGILNTRAFQYTIEMFCGQHKGNGYVGKLPIPAASPDSIKSVIELAKEIYFLAASLGRINEPSTEFCHPLLDTCLLTGHSKGVEQEFLAAQESDAHTSARLSSLQDSLDDVAFTLLDLDTADIQAIKMSTKSRPLLNTGLFTGIPHDSPGYLMARAQALVSYLVGIVYGRWDYRVSRACDTSAARKDPYSPLPLTAPGCLLEVASSTAPTGDDPMGYLIDICPDGILVDDPESPQDIQRRVRNTIRILWPTEDRTGHANIELDVLQMLSAPSLSEWFRRPGSFFAEHLNRYSKGRRQAPIYWQLSAGSGSYSAWLYYHRFTKDTLYRVLRDFVEPRIQQAERDQFELESQGSLSGEAANRLQKTQTLLQDLRIFKSELDLVAPLWNPNLNDGVIINHAILWRITPYTPWQKKCKECWDKLVMGDYDWAYLAFHLWPERVIPKCTTDRSLAIAHGLEERLWQETNNGNWLPRQLNEADLQALIAEHTNPAVKNALERFLAAPPPVAPTRTRASRSTRASGSSATRRPRGTAAVVDAEATRQVLLALTAAPSDGLAKAAIADLIGVEANALTAVIKQLKESGQIDQQGERRGARYVLSEQGRAAVEQEEAG
jgi:hypothetical protein